jgi:hypothetical protein
VNNVVGCELAPSPEVVPFNAKHNGHVLMVHWTKWAQQHYFDGQSAMVRLNPF